MRFRLLAHAALWIEHDGTSVLVDPWLQGTCYEGGWAQLPEPERLVDTLERAPSAIVFTHEHPDHFHVPTLKALAARFGASLPVLVPRLARDRMRVGLAKLGFASVSEMPLGKEWALGPGFAMTSWAVRADDTAQVFRGGGSTLVNANDCRLEGRLLRRIIAAAPNPDLYLGQFSIADGYPFRFEGVEDAAAKEAAAAPLDRFVRQSAAFAPRHKVPMASFVRFAAADNADANRWVTGLDAVRAAMKGDPALEVMHPGDAWSAEGGFAREEANAARYEAAWAAVRAGTAPLSPREAVPARGEIEEAAAARFADMFAKIPRALTKRIGVFGFHLDDAGRNLVVDWRERTLTWSDGTVREGVPFFRLGAGYFLKVCRSPWGWSNLHIGARFTVHAWKGTKAIQAFMPVSILYGLEYFDGGLRGFVSPRAISVGWRRRTEIVDLAMKAVRGKLWAKKPGLERV